MTAAIYFHPEGYSTEGPKLMGRNAAGESFLRGWLTYGKTDRLWAYVNHPTHAQVFANAAKAAGRTEAVSVFSQANLEHLAEPGCLFCPGPGIGIEAFKRAAFGRSRWSLCGITHTTSSASAMDAITDWIVAPVQPWDAVICTSQAVKRHVEILLDAQLGYLRDRLDIRRAFVPQLPVIPLGIHTLDFEFSREERDNARHHFGIDDDAVVVLFVGRLSFHAKAHPLAMYLALQQARRETRKEVVVVECGWHANAHIRKAFEDAAEAVCPGIRFIRVDGRAAVDRSRAWACADIFSSLSDNIQETFGITPIEAMAAGLPVVVTDWDGYKDTVRDGVDGFRIPTIMPPPGLGGDLALRYALDVDTYDIFCGNTCSFVCVDIDAAARAFTELFVSRDLRERMGNAGRVRARTVFDWAAIIPAYEDLWARMAELRHEAVQQGPEAWPGRLDPYLAFNHYGTDSVRLDTEIIWRFESLEETQAHAEAMRTLAMVNFAESVLPSEGSIRELIGRLSRQPRTISSILESFPPETQAYQLRFLLHLVKIGSLKLLSEAHS